MTRNFRYFFLLGDISKQKKEAKINFLVENFRENQFRQGKIFAIYLSSFGFFC